MMIYNCKVENDTALMIEVVKDLGTPWVTLKINSIYRPAEIYNFELSLLHTFMIFN